MVIRPKSVTQATPVLSTRTFACFTYQRGVRGVENVGLYPLKIPMNDPELVKVGHTRRDLRELKIVDE